MNICGIKQNRVLPEAQQNKVKKLLPHSLSRVNGWSPPLHSFLAISWTTYLAVSIVTFGIFIPFLQTNWKHVANIVSFVLEGWAPGLTCLLEGGGLLKVFKRIGPEPYHAYAVGSVSA